MERNRHESPALWKWCALGVGVVALEIAKGETLSACFKRGMENPHTRPFVLAGVGITVLHLLEALPESLDPYALLGKTEGFITRVTFLTSPETETG